jgi:acyl-CoA synthetase (AMP-forming)/AMP-acid ligase II
MSDNPVFPPLDGSISILPGLVDFHAQHNPTRPWAVLAPETGSKTTEISFLEFAKATHHVAHTFRPDSTHADGEMIAMLLDCDTVLYIALIAGLVRAGYVVRVSHIQKILKD